VGGVTTPRIVISLAGPIKLNGMPTPLTMRKDATGVYRLLSGTAIFGPPTLTSLSTARRYLATLSDVEISTGVLTPEGALLMLTPGDNLNVPLLNLEIPGQYSGPIITVTLRNTGSDDIEVTLPEGDVPIGGAMLVKICTRANTP
jgi:hypothetical protein